MNALERREWLAAVSACLPALRLANLARALEAVDAKGGAARWEGGFASDGCKLLALRATGIGRDAAAAFGAAVPAGEGLRVVWDAEKDALADLRSFGRGRRTAKASFGDPALRAALRDFERLAPFRALSFEPGGRWSLSLEPGLSWPSFLRCDVARGFAERGTQLSFLMRGGEVRELSFDGERLWAFVGS